MPASFELSNKHESETTRTEDDRKSCPYIGCSGTEADITIALNAEDSGSISTDRAIRTPSPQRRSFPTIVSEDSHYRSFRGIWDWLE